MFKYLKYLVKVKFFPHNLTNAEYLMYLRDNGIRVGEGTLFYAPNLWTVDLQRPWMVKIGSYCKIARGVQILAHDYSRSVLRRVYGEIIAEAKETVIGDNVFIGTNATILMGSRIGNNVIIGAGSIISGTIPDNTVYAGNPARLICSLDEYYLKRKSRYIEEAKDYVSLFIDAYGREPTIKEMGAFFPLFLERSIEALRNNGLRTKLGGDQEDDVIKCFLRSEAPFCSFDDFLKSIDRRK